MANEDKRAVGRRTSFSFRPWAGGYSPRELGYEPTDDPPVPKGARTGQMPWPDKNGVPRQNGNG
jgi:hypothetical protein